MPPRGVWPWGIQIGPLAVYKTYFYKEDFHFNNKSRAAFPFSCMPRKGQPHSGQAFYISSRFGLPIDLLLYGRTGYGKCEQPPTEWSPRGNFNLDYLNTSSSELNGHTITPNYSLYYFSELLQLYPNKSHASPKTTALALVVSQISPLLHFLQKNLGMRRKAEKGIGSEWG